MSAPAETSQATIRRVLGEYDLGAKIRALRMRKKVALVDLGKHTGLSASMLSQLENGKLVPTLPTLARIAMVFDVGLDYFFGEHRRRGLFSVVRAGQRIRFPDLPDAPKPNYFFHCLAFHAHEKGLQAYEAEFPSREKKEVREHMHDGAEFLYVIEGRLEVLHANETYELGPGDSAYFDASEPHSYRGAGEVPARAVVVTIPPWV